ncbi:potassium channel subfamily K member 5 [Dromiciops gliroides]|uniref:potassium channel subfamily K member 5 n=1 Tax=Dromiciops gliroides TaxID=33562 RepID=UPI001CC72E5C|nr:potassium channel subfamily K member 5 [Dromiciops gliroides]
MVDRGPLLTSAIIFYLSIGAAIFEVLEEPHWKDARDKYTKEKLQLLKDYPYLGQEGLDKILQVVSDAAGQGVAITGNQTFNNWNWPNAVIFAATVITTIGYGNVAPKTPAGRLFCIFYGLFGVPLCLTWINALGKFFGGRAKRLGQFLTKRGVSLRKAQITCTAIFIIWGVLVHLVIPPFVFMVTEDWDYIEGLYYSFITISTIGFGDYVAGVNPDANYHPLYRYFVELWIYLGLAWLSLFVNWKVSMFVEVHKAIKKRRRRRKESFESSLHSKKSLQMASVGGNTKDVNIFSFLSKKEETYNDLIKQIGKKGLKTSGGSGERVGGPDSARSALPAPPVGPLAIYTKARVPSFEEVSQTLRLKGHVSRSQGGDMGEGPPSDSTNTTSTVFVNQLDRISEEESEAWDARDSRPLIFENANITFVNEEGGLSDEDTSKSSLDDNLAGEEEEEQGEEEEEAGAEMPLNLGEFPSSDDSTFTSTESELSVPYEQLMNEYNKVNSPRGT